MILSKLMIIKRKMAENFFLNMFYAIYNKLKELNFMNIKIIINMKDHCLKL